MDNTKKIIEGSEASTEAVTNKEDMTGFRKKGKQKTQPPVGNQLELKKINFHKRYSKPNTCINDLNFGSIMCYSSNDTYTKNILCENFNKKGYCCLGQKCPYLHKISK